ncbi:MAG: UvrD-helicase domain-containing protein [Pseudomonadota bacterium]|nr:UvrD-helicase domain-containing protein [Pseudomonadota bacterium]
MNPVQPRLADHAARVAAMTAHDRTLLVEAGAGVGKTAVLAGRIVLLLAAGVPPRSIAAVTFTELAAGELLARVRTFADELLSGRVPVELAAALPEGLDEDGVEALLAASADLDAIACSTIHGFCQRLITPYPAETGIDPGASVLDASEADLLFEETLDDWLHEALSESDGSILPELVYLRAEETVQLVRDVAAELRKEGGLVPPPPARNVHEAAGDFIDAARAYAAFARSAPADEPETRRRAECFAEMADDVEAAAAAGGSAGLARLLTGKPHPELCKADGDFRAFQQKGKWATAVKASGLPKGEGPALFDQANSLHQRCCAEWKTLLGTAAAIAIAEIIGVARPAVARYRVRKREAALLDFDDLIMSARDLLRHRPAIREALSSRYRHILVDEFQDTDPRQSEIFWRLAAAAPGPEETRWQDLPLAPGALFLVGDPKQSIYRFRGADAAAYREAREAILRAGEDGVLTITTNFRSCAPIIGFVNERFRAPMQEDGQPGFAALDAFHPDPGAGPCVAALDVTCADAEGKASSETQRDCEAEAVATLCSQLIGHHPVADRTGGERPCRPGDIALLAPTGTDLWRYEEALERAGIPVATQAGKGLFRRQEVQDLIAVTRVLVDPRDTLGLAAFLRGPLVGLSDEELLDLAWETRIAGMPPRLSLDTGPEEITNPLAQAALARLQLLRRRANSTTPHLLLVEAVDALRVRPMLMARHGPNAARALANVDAFLDLARPYALRGLRAFAAAMRTAWEEGSAASEGWPDAPEEAVALYTVHSSKGLEWPVVVPINMMTRATQPTRTVVERAESTLHMKVLGVAPPGLADAFEAEDAEARRERQRLWYVAATRARELLVLPRLNVRSGPASWAALVDLGLDDVPTLAARAAVLAPEPAPPEPETRQTRQSFAAEAKAVVAATARIRWEAPSAQEALATGAAEPAALQEAVTDIAGSARRGILLHKLIEEILSGETSEEPTALASRAGELAAQLDALEPVDSREIAKTAAKALALPELREWRARLLPEITVLSSTVADDDIERIVSGVADAVAIGDDGRPQLVVDWKSDVSPSPATIEHYKAQVRRYLEATGAVRGLIVLATSGTAIEVA